MTTKIDLKDVSFLIPVRIDSQERMENLILVLEFIKTHFDTHIIVLEADQKEQVHHSCIDTKIFIEDHDPVFYRTKYLNRMARNSLTSFLAIWDTDVLLNPLQIKESVKLLQSESADMVLPYDGKCYNVPPVLVNLYKVKNNIAVLNSNMSKMKMMYGHFNVGGAFIVNKKAYIETGMENENFYGWGPEDAERVKRWEILGYNIKRVNAPLFHLYHPKMSNSWFGSKELELRNRKEFVKICGMDRKELTNYITSINM